MVNQDDKKIKRMTVLIPQELYDKFQDMSGDEYKTNTAIVVEWISAYVRDKESVAKKMATLLETFSKASDTLFSLGALVTSDVATQGFFTELSTLMLELVNSPELNESESYKKRLTNLELRVRQTVSERQAKQLG